MSNKTEENKGVKVDVGHIVKKSFKYLFIIWGVAFVVIAGILAFLFM